MRLLIVRHAKAEDRETFDGQDAERPLTDSGRQRFRAVAKGLRKIAPDIDLLVTSPLVRARQTAEVLARVFAVRDVVDSDLLVPGASRKALLEWLNEQSEDQVIALVGHEPDLSEFTSFLMARSNAPQVQYRKGGAALLACGGPLAPGQVVLEWLIPPAALRRLA